MDFGPYLGRADLGVAHHADANPNASGSFLDEQIKRPGEHFGLSFVGDGHVRSLLSGTVVSAGLLISRFLLSWYVDFAHMLQFGNLTHQHQASFSEIQMCLSQAHLLRLKTSGERPQFIGERGCVVLSLRHDPPAFS